MNSRPQPKAGLKWLLLMAWRDSRRNRGRLILFMSAIVLGIAALVAINTFGANLRHDIEDEAKTLLGADLRLESNFPAADSIRDLFDSWPATYSEAVYFVSMVLAPEQGATRLAQVRAMVGDYPFYGQIKTTPADAYSRLNDGPYALVERSLMLQFDLHPGDSLKIGEAYFELIGQMDSSPGRSGISGSVAPVVYIPLRYLEQTGLIQVGSRVDYLYFFAFPSPDSLQLALDASGDLLAEAGWNSETVADRKEGLGNAFDNLTGFLNLVAFIALLLGCIGVASSVHIYLRDKVSTIAMLRCLGASGRQAFRIYLWQVFLLGLAGGIAGALLGSLIQVVLPTVMAEFLPVDEVSRSVSPAAIGEGVLTGVIVTLLFGLLSLLPIRRISPLQVLRASYQEQGPRRDPLRWLVMGAIALFILLFTRWQTGSWQSWVFPVGVGISLLILAGVARLLSWSVQRFFPKGWSFSWRQGIANLYRPNNQTTVLLVTIGLGTALIATLFFIQEMLLQRIAFTGSGDRPNMILFDIQPPQREGVAELCRQYDLPVQEEVPIVTMRLDNIGGIDKAAFLRDSSSGISRWVYDREYRVTYRDSLIASETVIEGEWKGGVADDGVVYISIERGFAEDMGVEIGSKVTFNVQGALVETVVGSLREIDFQRFQTNFLVVFPSGVLEQAPQFFVQITRADSEEASARFQRALVQAFPNVSAIDLSQVLSTVETVLNKVSFVIRFMALFSMLTGLIVLIGSVSLSRYQRLRESVLLRTIGASRRQILQINAVEYLILGLLAALTGLLLAMLASWALAIGQFEVDFQPNWWPVLGLSAVITLLTLLIGLSNNRAVVNYPPLEVLRREA